MAEDFDAFLRSSKFVNEIISYEDNDSCGYIAEVRCSIRCSEEVKAWLEEFEHKTHTKWNVRSTCPHAKRVAFKCEYVCQHSSFNKSTSTKTRKNTSCPATLKIQTDLDTCKTRRNPFVKVS